MTGGHARITDFFIKPEYRGKGFELIALRLAVAEGLKFPGATAVDFVLPREGAKDEAALLAVLREADFTVAPGRLEMVDVGLDDSSRVCVPIDNGVSNLCTIM